MKKGFTLVELLIVVIIIGILATLAIPQYQKMANRAKWSEAMQLGDAIKTSENLYYAENGTYYSGNISAMPNPPEIPLIGNRKTAYAIGANGTDTVIYAVSTARQGADDFGTSAPTDPYFELNVVTNSTSFGNGAPSDF